MGGSYLVYAAAGIICFAVKRLFKRAYHYPAIGSRMYKLAVFKVNTHMKDRLLWTTLKKYQVAGAQVVFLYLFYVLGIHRV